MDKKVTPEVHKIIMERISAVLSMVNEYQKIPATEDQRKDLSTKLYEGFYDFFGRAKLKYSNQITHLRNLMVGKDKKYVNNLDKQINLIIDKSHEDEKDMVCQTIHKWEKGIEHVQAN